jgi:hypothetical protein
MLLEKPNQFFQVFLRIILISTFRHIYQIDRHKWNSLIRHLTDNNYLIINYTINLNCILERIYDHNPYLFYILLFQHININ